MDIVRAIQLALPLIYDTEGCKLAAYLDKLPIVPVWTIGHGTTFVDGKPVRQGMTCTREQADQWAIDTLSMLASEMLTEIHVTVSDQQFAACLSLAYNCGIGAFSRSTVLQALNGRLYFRAADRFRQYNHAGGVVEDGLTARRERERALFLSGTDPAPSIPTLHLPAKPAVPVESDTDKLNEAELLRERAETERLKKGDST
jgi:lysozyme